MVDPRLDDQSYLDRAFDVAVERLRSGSTITTDELASSKPHLRTEIDELIRAVIESAEGPKESEIVMALLKLRDVVSGRVATGPDWVAALELSRTDVAALVNEYFRAKLYGIAPVAEFLAEFQD